MTREEILVTYMAAMANNTNLTAINVAERAQALLALTVVPDGWIAHDGKGYPPISRDTVVHIRTRDGMVSTDDAPEPVSFWGDKCNWWVWGNSSGNEIVAYKVVS